MVQFRWLLKDYILNCLSDLENDDVASVTIKDGYSDDKKIETKWLNTIKINDNSDDSNGSGLASMCACESDWQNLSSFSLEVVSKKTEKGVISRFNSKRL